MTDDDATKSVGDDASGCPNEFDDGFGYWLFRPRERDAEVLNYEAPSDRDVPDDVHSETPSN